ncbi:MAG TPA: PilN domain-containing protein [Solirubrobacterales bacterium]
MRTGPLVYVVLGLLVAVLAGITAMALTDNRIADRKDEIARLEAEDAAASARAQRLSAYTQFRALREQRVATVTSLADSRFDWERVMRELSLILPDNVWLVSLNASASPEAGAGGAASASGGASGSGLRSSAPGPALEISGCATGQEAVAGFLTALKDIDGVTRVGVQSSALAEQSSAGTSGGGGASGGGSSDDCRTRAFITKFEIVVAFDAAPVPVTAAPASVTAAPPVDPATSTTSEGG